MKHSVISSRVDQLLQSGYEFAQNMNLRPLSLENNMILDLSEMQILVRPENPQFIIAVAKTAQGRCVEFPFRKLTNGIGPVVDILNHCGDIADFRYKMSGKLVEVKAIVHEFVNQMGNVVNYNSYTFAEIA